MDGTHLSKRKDHKEAIRTRIPRRWCGSVRGSHFDRIERWLEGAKGRTFFGSPPRSSHLPMGSLTKADRSAIRSSPVSPTASYESKQIGTALPLNSSLHLKGSLHSLLSLRFSTSSAEDDRCLIDPLLKRTHKNPRSLMVVGIKIYRRSHQLQNAIRTRKHMHPHSSR